MEPCVQEERIRALEQNDLSNSKDIKHLISRMDKLVSILLKILYTLVPLVFMLFAFLISYWVKG